MTTFPKISIDTEKDIDMCFACGRNNPIGLKLSFQQEGKTVRAEFTPSRLYQGWADIVHGGILHCILDEAMSYAALFEGLCCVTARMESRFKRPALINEPLIITSSITRNARRFIETKANISLKDGTLIAEGTATLFVVSRNMASPALRRISQKAMPESKARGVIWDMDGVIADTAPYHFQAWHRVFREKGVNFTKEDFRHNFGQRNDTIIRNTLGAQIPQSEIDTIAKEKEETFRKLAIQNIKPLPGAIKLIKSLGEHGFKLAIASSAPMENIQLVTQGLGINSCFQAMVCGRDVAEGKPSPQGFLLAAQKLGVEPENCIVIEDAIAGVTACKRAGTHCVAVTNTHPRENLTEADLIVDTLEAVSVNDLEGLFSSP